MVSFFGFLFGILVGLSVLVIVGALMGIPVMFCWNLTMPFIFDLPRINVFHGMGLWFLCFMLFKNHGVGKDD